MEGLKKITKPLSQCIQFLSCDLGIGTSHTWKRVPAAQRWLQNELTYSLHVAESFLRS